MRIILEIDQAGQVVVPGATPQQDVTSDLDGGTPSPALMSGLPGVEVTAGDSVGGPPDWLVREIEAAMAAEMAASEPSAQGGDTTDGGPAPA